MSGGASVPSAPNLSGNISNANNTFGTATSNAAQTMNTAQAYNQNAQQNLQGVTANANSMAGQIGNQATQNMNTYGSTFVPLQAQQAQQAQMYGGAANVQKLQGQAVANSNAANQAARANSQQALAAEGVDPASLQGAALDRQAGVTGAANTAGAATQSALNTQNTAIGLTSQANQLGLQVGGQGTQGAATAAQTGLAGQAGVNATNQSGVNNLTAANSYLNTGVNANNSSAQIAGQGFGEQMQQYQAQNAQNAGTMAAIGSIAGGAMSFMERGGPVLPTGEEGPYTGINVGRHSGLPVNPRHFQPTSAMTFRNMESGGPVSTQGALPVGSLPGTTDRKPAMLTPDEFVIPKDVANFKGHAFFHNMIDKSREEMNTRRAVPVNHPPHMSAN